MEVRRLRRGEGARIRELRLRALSDAPYAFSSSLAAEEGEPPSEWEALAGRSEEAEADVVFVAVEGDTWLGMAGGYLHGDDGTAGLWGMWVAPEARRRGVAGRLLDAVTGWAIQGGAERLHLSVTDRATAAASLYSRAGFQPTGERRPLDSDPSLTEVFLSRPLTAVSEGSRPASP